MGKMTVYHGSYTSIQKPEIRIGRNTKDFGAGFYCTTIHEQALRWAKRYTQSIVNKYTVRLDTSLDILEFKEMTDEWLDFIIGCDMGSRTSMISLLALWQTTRFIILSPTIWTGY